MIDIRVISIGALSAHPLWGERAGSPVRTGHATTTLIQSGDAKILVDPGLPPQMLESRLAERARLSAREITHVFLTSFHPDTHRGIRLFDHAPWLISATEREGVGIPLINQLKKAKDLGEAGMVELLSQEIAILQKCEVASDELAFHVDVFPLHGVTPGLTGVLIEEDALTTLITGDAIPTIEHVRQRKVLPNASDLEKAKASFGEAMQIADVLILGRDGPAVNIWEDGANID